MFVPITSEVNLSTGMVLKEIATDHLFEVSERLANGSQIWGEDSWRITENEPTGLSRPTLTMTRQELAMKYLAEVEE